ncbi:ATP-dependent carboxylate-amine ligase [Selenomonas sp. oral taxon 920]|uniref:ATP-grasp domain-containing protein n=1 Tax=Selenomonas sp. oral taxon 920 TaxID=1884263 RepID=UPI000840A6E9|nr:ATP-dependent carboxylate-amine ligase [Selenomonas sp. oral taxon 920]
MLFHKVLVTGCGGDIGLAIGRILQEERCAAAVIGCDIEADHAGWVFFDDCFVVERATSSNYMDSLMQLVEKEHIDLVIPSSEPELRTLYANDFFGRKDLFLTANKKAMEVGFDKYRTAEFLQKHGLPHPWTQIAAHGMPQEFPCILKSRTGCGSKDVRILTEENNCDQVFESKDEIFQELIEGDDAEYTCGLFRSSSGEIRSIILRRKLRGGLTGSGIVETNSEIEELLHAIALHLDLQGSINVQLRLRAGIPYVFEINPRFSSTVRFRYKLGFSDVIWSMQDFLHRVVDRYQTPMIGTRFYKIYEDIIG